MADVRVMDEEWGNSGYEVAFDFTKAQRGTVLGAYRQFFYVMGIYIA